MLLPLIEISGWRVTCHLIFCVFFASISVEKHCKYARFWVWEILGIYILKWKPKSICKNTIQEVLNLTRFSCCRKFILGELWKLKNLVGNVIFYKKFNAQNSLNMNFQEHENCVISEDLLYILDMCARNHYARQTYDMSKYACTCEKSIVIDCEMMMRVWRMICRYS